MVLTQPHCTRSHGSLRRRTTALPSVTHAHTHTQTHTNVRNRKSKSESTRKAGGENSSGAAGQPLASIGLLKLDRVQQKAGTPNIVQPKPFLPRPK